MAKRRALLIHSGGFSSRQWRKLAELLAPTHDVIAPDLIGYGTSGAWPIGAPFHFAQDVELLASLVDDAPGQPEPVDVVGHSYGGFLALQLALARPAAVRSIAVYEPVAFGILDEPADAPARAELALIPPTFDDPEAWLTQFVDWWNGPGAWTAMSDDARGSFRAVGWKLFQEVVTLLADRTDRASYGAIRAPTLLLGGDRSPAVEQRTLAKLAAALPAATLEVLAGLGHMGPITDHRRVNAAIARHLGA